MTKTRLVWCLSIAAAVLVLLPLAGCKKTAAEQAAQTRRVTVEHPKVRSLTDEDEYNGWLEAHETINVVSRVSGHIQKIYFNDGDLVKKGQPLFDLDQDPFVADVNRVVAQQKALEAQRVAAQKDADRYATLVKQNAVSKQEYEKVVADAESFAAQVKAKEAEAERIKLDLKYSKITAELSGRIGKAELTVGNYVSAQGNSPVLTTIVAVDPIYVAFNVDERAIQRYQQEAAAQPGSDKPKPLRERKLPFTFELDTEKGFPNSGIIVFADNKYDEGTGTILLRGETANPKGRFIVGSRVRVRVPTSDKYDAVVVPDSAVLADQDKRYLLALGKDNVVVRRDFTPGKLLDDGMRVVLPPPGEKAPDMKAWAADFAKQWIVTVGLQSARINYPVTPLGPDGKSIDAAASAPASAPAAE